jgi:hypothetical protein
METTINQGAHMSEDTRPTVVPALNPTDITGCQRPPWWRPFARRRWDRTVELARWLYAETASRMGVLVAPGRTDELL